jgi:hypothetical protein
MISEFYVYVSFDIRVCYLFTCNFVPCWIFIGGVKSRGRRGIDVFGAVKLKHICV